MPWAWVPAKYEKKLQHIAQHVEGLWKVHKPNRESVWFTCHDDKHSRQAAEAVKLLLPEADCRRAEITDHERFCLLAAAWLHDVGMIPGLMKADARRVSPRAEHHERSRDYIIENCGPLGLNHADADVIGNIAWYHPKRTKINVCAPKIGNVRTRMLACYLRLADAITRTHEDVDKRMFNTLIGADMPLLSQFHWIKSLFVTDIDPRPLEKKIVIQVTRHDDDADEMGTLGEIVRTEIREELETVQYVILLEGATHYLNVDLDFADSPGPTPHRDQLETLRQYLGNRDLEFQAPARELARTLLRTVHTLATGVNDEQAYTAIHEFVTQAVDEIRQARACHALFTHIHQRLCFYASEPPDQVHDPGAKVREILTFVGDKLRIMDEKLATVVRFSHPFLRDGEPILLFGRSTSVVACLRDQPFEVKKNTKIYVLENRSKTRFNFLGEMYYCDGLQYAEEVAGAGYPEVYIVPDLTVANLMEQKTVRKVVFGANGIDLRQKIILHTAGHRTIADLAKTYDIPLFVIADSEKFGPAERDREREREGWLKEDNRLLEGLPDSVSLFNPREDAVECDKVTMLITDKGAFQPDSPPLSVMSGACAVLSEESRPAQDVRPPPFCGEPASTTLIGNRPESTRGRA